MTDASVMLLYSLMNDLPIRLIGVHPNGSENEDIYGITVGAHVRTIEKVSNAGRHELRVYFDGSSEAHYYDPAKIKVTVYK